MISQASYGIYIYNAGAYLIISCLDIMKKNDLRGEETYNLPLFQDANVTVCIRHLLSVYPNKIYNI